MRTLLVLLCMISLVVSQEPAPSTPALLPAVDQEDIKAPATFADSIVTPADEVAPSQGALVVVPLPDTTPAPTATVAPVAAIPATVVDAPVVSEKGEKPWEFGVDLSAKFAMNNYSDSWKGTEEGSMAWLVRFIGDMNKTFVKHFRWENNLKVEYGRSKIQSAPDSGATERPDWQRWKVNADELDYKTLGAFPLQRTIEPYVDARVQTKFMDQIATNDSVQYFNPVIINEGLGGRITLLKKYKEQQLDFQLGAAFYQNINRKIDTYTDGGIQFVTNYKAILKDDILHFASYLNLYQAIVADEDIRPTDTWKTIDIEWSNDLSVHVAKVLVFSYSGQIRYDREISEKVRYKQIVSAGFAFMHRNKAMEDATDPK